ncbi:MAG TPA: hypothetical protein EYP10_08680, partial [Armatimonadetes bacterium]|nr:hypothetical protein [Armatimonadota bacterium]
MMRYGEFKILSMSATLALIGFALIGSAECSTSVATRHLNLVQNGSFEVGIAPWTTQHRWFEYGGLGKGHGISKWQCTDETARNGRYSLKVIGQNNRGIAIQDLQLPPIRYRVSGWIKCLNIERGEAQMLVEFIGAGNKWLCGQRIGGVRGTADWTFVSGEVECPEDAIILRVDLLTTEPNNGIAWFDDIIVAPAIRDEKPPVPVPFTCSGDGVSGLQLNWSKAKVERDVTLFHVFVETERFSNIAKLTPRAILPRWQRMWTIFGLPKRASYYVAIVPVDIFGNRVTEVEAVKVKCADRIPPHAPEFDVSPIWSRTPMAHLTWTPLPIDNDIASYRILARVNGKVHELKEIAQRNGLSCEAMVKLPDAEKPIEIAVIAIDSAGNESQANWKKVLPCTDARIGDTFINPYGLCEIAHVRIADDGGLELAPKDYDPAVLPGDLTKLLKSPEEIEYHASGYAITRPIILPPAKRSIHLQYDAHVPDGTTVRIDVLDATGNVLLENAPSGAQLNDDNVDSTIIRLKISLTTNDVHRTP